MSKTGLPALVVIFLPLILLFLLLFLLFLLLLLFSPLEEEWSDIINKLISRNLLLGSTDSTFRHEVYQGKKASFPLFLLTYAYTQILKFGFCLSSLRISLLLEGKFTPS